MPTSTLTSKGQVTIPKPVRERLGVKTGDRLIFRFSPDGTLVVEPEGEPPLGRLPGLLRHLAPAEPVTVEAMRQGVRQRAPRRHRAGKGR